MTLTYCWLGAAGLELAAEDFVLLIDPFFTRPGKAAMLLGARVAGDMSLPARYAPRADAVLVTHPHYDHLLDVPEILRRTGARAYGSPNACTLLGWHGIPAEQAQCIANGDQFRAGPFMVEVLTGYHRPIPLSRLWNGPLVGIPRQFPLRLTDYRMDVCYSYRITLHERSLLVGSHPAPPAEVLFIAPSQPEAGIVRVLQAVQPRQVVPIHWDDFNRPLSQPLRPMLAPPLPGEPVLPPLRRVNLSAFARLVRRTLPSTVVQVPELFQPVRLWE